MPEFSHASKSRLTDHDLGRFAGHTLFDRLARQVCHAGCLPRKELFEEGISSSRMYLDPERPGVEDLIDSIVAGVRSSFTYAGARSIAEFRERALVGVQSASGYDEGRPRETSWS